MNKVSLLISVIAVFISGCIAFQYEIETDNASFTLGVLTALVTVLIAWNIFSLVDFNHKKEELSKETETVKQLITLSNSTNAANSAINDEALAMLYYYLITKKPIESLEYQYINHSISAIVNLAIANREKECNFFIDLLLDTVSDPQKLTIKQEKINEMLVHLGNMPNKNLYSNYSKLVYMISKICGKD